MIVTPIRSGRRHMQKTRGAGTCEDIVSLNQERKNEKERANKI